MCLHSISGPVVVKFNMSEDEQQQDLLLDDQAMDHQLLLDIDQDFPNTPSSEPIASGDDQDHRGKRKRNHRHSTHQIQRLEAFFKECPHPDDAQRKLLGLELGLEPLQVKFWFQNKRTQLKNHNEKEDNQRLKDENDQLISDNLRLKEALSSACCPNCGGPHSLGEITIDEQELQAQNARLRNEIERISAIVAEHANQQLMSFQMLPPSAQAIVGFFGAQSHSCLIESNNVELFIPVNGESEIKKMTPLALAQVAMEELLTLAQLGEPIWTSSYNYSTETLIEEEYARAFPRGLWPKMVGLRTEASRHSAIVCMNTGRLLDILMDVGKWSTFFSSIVARATTVETYSTGKEATYDGTLQLVTAELQVPTPLVPLREGLFLRYCKHHGEHWVVVDVSMLQVHENQMPKYRRRPSGCIIQEMPNDCSKVIWIEHVEVDDSGIHHLYKSILNSGLTFGAKRWLAILTRQCEKLASLMDINNSTSLKDANSDAMRSILKLAERMMISFCSGVSGSAAHHWADVSGTVLNDVRIRSRKNNGNPGRPPGVVLSASTSIWLPVAPKRIFNLLRGVPSRNQWDILLHGGMLYEALRIVNGQEQGNCVSIFTVGLPQEVNNMMILQESFSDTTCSYIIYAPVDAAIINSVLRGGDPHFVALLPTGFAILPDRPSTLHGGIHDEDNSGGSLLTVAFQILLDCCPDSKISMGSIATVKSLLSCTCDRIRDILLGNNVQ
ncbi:homeobox-leucine zipper protein ROC2-like [Canna indica]|uniref:Homeobox-leucine zipper protein ROC2-like n=1 Tax=Canna indica TaxID=4628 RepID=A0AAQ3QE89_9LILI|nr:homeobox-leucine zipper protein ROC2-like [Canna indica]